MSKDIWDDFGRWDEFAKLEDVSALKNAISGSGLWTPNFASQQIQYAFRYAVEESIQTDDRLFPTVIDFGCGLGRNVPMLKKYFPRVVGFDLPDMISRLQPNTPQLADRPYSRLYSNEQDLLASERFCTLYDSVALQHITDFDFLSSFMAKLTDNPFFQTLVTMFFSGGNRSQHLEVLEQQGWSLWWSEHDAMSFRGAPHTVSVYRR